MKLGFKAPPTRLRLRSSGREAYASMRKALCFGKVGNCTVSQHIKRENIMGLWQKAKQSWVEEYNRKTSVYDIPMWILWGSLFAAFGVEWWMRGSLWLAVAQLWYIWVGWLLLIFVIDFCLDRIRPKQP
jgi:hypothetical protein